MKVAFIGQKGIPATFGGIEYCVEEVSSRLAEYGHEIYVYVRRWYTPAEMNEHNGVRLVHMFNIKTKYLDAFTHALFSTVHCLFRDYDIIHYQGIGPSFFCWIPKLFGRKIVLTVHSLPQLSNKWPLLAKKFLELTELIGVASSDTIIAVSRFLKDYLSSKYNKKTVYITNGVKSCCNIVEPDIIADKFNLHGKDYILWLGRISSEKRVEWLIKGFKRYCRRNISKDIKLVIAGGVGDTYDYLQKVKDLADDHKGIIFTDYVTGREKEELLGNALVFILPSYLEGLPIALLEAMSCGLPCLASDISAHREIIDDGKNGILFSTDEFDDFMVKFSRLLDEDPEVLRQMAEKGRKKVRQEYNWEKIVKETENIYYKICARRDNE